MNPFVDKMSENNEKCVQGDVLKTRLMKKGTVLNSYISLRSYLNVLYVDTVTTLIVKPAVWMNKDSPFSSSVAMASQSSTAASGFASAQKETEDVMMIRNAHRRRTCHLPYWLLLL